MRLPRIGLTFLALFTIFVETPKSLNLIALLGVPRALAETPANRKTEADRLLQQGIQQAQASQFQAALQLMQQALTIYQAIGDRQGEASALGNLGLAYFFLGNFTKAIEYHEQSLAIARQINDRQTQGRALVSLGIAYDSLGDYRRAIEYHKQSLAIAREIQNRQGEVSALGSLGNAYHSLGDYKKAIEYYQQTLAIAREIHNRQGETSALGSLGSAYRDLGDYKKAIEYYQQTLAIAREIDDHRGEGQALGNLGLVYHNLGDYKKAIEYHEQDLALARKINDRRGEGQALGNLGIAYSSLGDYKKAIEYHEQSLAIARGIQNRAGEAAALGSLGNAYRALGDYRQAIEYHEQSLAIARAIGNRQSEAAALGSLGNAYLSLGDYRRAIEYYEKDLAIAREIGDRRGEGSALVNLGAGFLALLDYPKAIKYHEQSLAIAREIGDRQGEAKALGSLGSAYRYLGDYPKAIEYHQQYLAIAREIGDRRSEGQALVNLGAAYYFLEEYAKAIEYCEQSFTIAEEIKDLQGKGTALNNLGSALFGSGNLTKAQTILDQGIQVWESIREGLRDNDAFKVSIFEEQVRTYLTLQKVQVALNKPEDALVTAERGRARAFVELLTRRLSNKPNNQLDITPPSIEQIQKIAKQQNSTLVQYSIIYDYFKVQGRVQVKQSELYIWVISPTGEIAFRKVDLKSLNTPLQQLVTSSRQSIGVRGRASVDIVLKPGADEKQRLQQLHDLLIKPIADLLPTDPQAHVIFIPHQELFLVPFVALQDEQGKYLIEKHTILTAPSIQVLELTRSQREQLGAKASVPLQNPNMLIVGNPTMPSISLKFGEKAQPLSSLPGAEREATAIAQLFNLQPLLGSQATETTIKSKLPNADIIHLATHGLLDYGLPQGELVREIPGALALAPDPPTSPEPKAGQERGDGLLTSDEILNLKLNAFLVVLSACDTGRGELTSEGVIGLSRAFISAGTPSIIVSLWSVPDSPTADLMKEFYRQLQQNPDKAQALRQAMLITMKQHPHPKDWAAFTLIGEAE